jgi:hypothetical protein
MTPSKLTYNIKNSSSEKVKTGTRYHHNPQISKQPMEQAKDEPITKLCAIGSKELV